MSAVGGEVRLYPTDTMLETKTGAGVIGQLVGADWQSGWQVKCGQQSDE